jgi:hypothetical protein
MIWKWIHALGWSVELFGGRLLSTHPSIRFHFPSLGWTITFTVVGGVAIAIEGKLKNKWFIAVWCCMVHCWFSASSHRLDPPIVFLFMVHWAAYFAAVPYWWFFLSPHGESERWERRGKLISALPRDIHRLCLVLPRLVSWLCSFSLFSSI